MAPPPVPLAELARRAGQEMGLPATRQQPMEAPGVDYNAPPRVASSLGDAAAPIGARPAGSLVAAVRAKQQAALELQARVAAATADAAAEGDVADAAAAAAADGRPFSGPTSGASLHASPRHSRVGSPPSALPPGSPQMGVRGAHGHLSPGSRGVAHGRLSSAADSAADAMQQLLQRAVSPPHVAATSRVSNGGDVLAHLRHQQELMQVRGEGIVSAASQCAACPGSASSLAGPLRAAAEHHCAHDCRAGRSRPFWGPVGWTPSRW